MDPGLAALAFADLDGDGVLDAAATRFTSELSIVRGVAPGRLDIPDTLWFEDARPIDVIAMDENGDQLLDLVALSPRALHVFRSSEDGFLPREKQDLDGFAQDLVQGDFDGDGRVEVAFSDIVGGKVVVVFLAAGGGVTGTLEHHAGVLPSRLAAADLDGDGATDLVVTDLGDPSLHVLLGPAREGETALVDIPLGAGQTAAATGDANGDGAPDIVVSTSEKLHLVLGDGRGGLAVERTFEDLGDSKALAIADLDGEGRADLVAGGGKGISILFSLAHEAAPRRGTRDLGFDVEALEVRDLDFDGKPEIVTADQRSGQVVVLRGIEREGGSSEERYTVGGG
ncbi:MAG: VCBS repeat-containing protein, partial [Actinobacteria bacterium]|nr:VCBS repeat-containing protein [Actinomycetota bacterium]